MVLTKRDKKSDKKSDKKTNKNKKTNKKTDKTKDVAVANTKVSAIKKTNKKTNKKGISKFTSESKKVNREKNEDMRQKGITVRVEHRFEDLIAGSNESRIIGHTSIPCALTWYNACRALIKCVFGYAGIHVPAFTEACGMKGTIQFKYYDDWHSSTLNTSVYSIPTTTPLTWDALSGSVAEFIRTLGVVGKEPDKMRWISIEYLPEDAFNKNYPGRINLPMSQMYVTIHSKSMLKFQNQSGVYREATPAELYASTDDVDAIPVEVYTYYVTGNLFIHQNTRKSAAIGMAGLGFDETFTNNQVGSEPVPAHQILNCTGKDKFILDPGHIKTSIMSYKKKILFSQLIRMLFRRGPGSGTNPWDFQVDGYVKSLGHARALHIDRVVGREVGKVRLGGELEVKQNIMVEAKQNFATDQVEFQIN